MRKFLLLAALFFTTNLIGFSKEIALQEIERTYDTSVREGGINSYSMSKSWFSMALASPVKEKIQNIGFSVVQVLQDHVNRIKEICERYPEEAISIYFLEKYLPLYERQSKEKLIKVVLFFKLGLAEVENVFTLSEVREYALESIIKQQIAKDLIPPGTFLEEIKKEIEEETLQKILLICRREEETFFQQMHQELLHYETLQDYYGQIDLKGVFFKVLQERFNTESNVEREIKTLILEYKSITENLSGGIF